MMIDTPCTIVRRTEIDDGYYSDYDESDVDTVCELQLKSQDEPTGAGELSRTEFNVYFFGDAPEFRTGDALLVGGEEYEFIGSPPGARNSRTQEVEHIKALVVRTKASGDSS